MKMSRAAVHSPRLNHFLLLLIMANSVYMLVEPPKLEADSANAKPHRRDLQVLERKLEIFLCRVGRRARVSVGSIRRTAAQFKAVRTAES